MGREGSEPQSGAVNEEALFLRLTTSTFTPIALHHLDKSVPPLPVLLG